MADLLQKPVLFLDFDQTLFDTDQLRDWLGDDIDAAIARIEAGTLEFPDLSAMLYPDTLPFLQAAKTTHRLVLLTTASHPIYQQKKVHGSGVTGHLDDLLITPYVSGNAGKGVAAKDYLHARALFDGSHVFVDDLAENLFDVKVAVPHIRSIRIKRASGEAEALPHAPDFAPDAAVSDLHELARILNIATSFPDGTLSGAYTPL